MFEQLHRGGTYFERFRSQPPMYDLLNDAGKANEELGKRIAAADGRVAILVHPFYADGNAAHLPIDEQYRAQLGSFMAEINADGLPLIIFEASSQVAKINHLLPHREQPAFLVRTPQRNATPDVFPQHLQYLISKKDEDSALDRLIAVSLKANNARRAFVGGRYLFMETPYRSPAWYQEGFMATARELETGKAWTEHSLYPTGCVGTVVRSLFRHGIEVDIASATAPGIPFRDVRDRAPVLQAGELF